MSLSEIHNKNHDLKYHICIFREPFDEKKYEDFDIVIFINESIEIIDKDKLLNITTRTEYTRFEHPFDTFNTLFNNKTKWEHDMPSFPMIWNRRKLNTCLSSSISSSVIRFFYFWLLFIHDKGISEITKLSTLLKIFSVLEISVVILFILTTSFKYWLSRVEWENQL